MWPQALRCHYKASDLFGPIGQERPLVIDTGSTLTDLLYSVEGILDHASYDRIYVFGRSGEELDNYFLSEHHQRLGS